MGPLSFRFSTSPVENIFYVFFISFLRSGYFLIWIKISLKSVMGLKKANNLNRMSHFLSHARSSVSVCVFEAHVEKSHSFNICTHRHLHTHPPSHTHRHLVLISFISLERKIPHSKSDEERHTFENVIFKRFQSSLNFYCTVFYDRPHVNIYFI